MAEKNIVVLGPMRADLPTLRCVAGEFGWAVGAARDLHDLTEPPERTVAVFLQREVFGKNCAWPEAIRLFRCASPERRVVACHGFAETVDWRQLSEMGAFHAIGLPFQENEVRQSMGFIWEAEKRAAATAEQVANLVSARRLGTALRAESDRERSLRNGVRVYASGHAG